jgi:hypothetical protein
VQRIDDLLCNASESQLRNVLAMVKIPDAELIALFEREEKTAAREHKASVVEEDLTFAKQIGMEL